MSSEQNDPEVEIPDAPPADQLASDGDQVVEGLEDDLGEKGS